MIILTEAHIEMMLAGGRKEVQVIMERGQAEVGRMILVTLETMDLDHCEKLGMSKE